MTHANLPLRAGVYGWFFTAAEYHHAHHSTNLAQSNCNYGCNVIIWDRIFGTFCSAPTIDGVVQEGEPFLFGSNTRYLSFQQKIETNLNSTAVTSDRSTTSR